MPRRSSPSFGTKKRWTEADARSVLDALERSGLSAQAFASRAGLELQRLQRWRRRLDATEAVGEGEQPTFVEVRRASAAVVEVVLGGGRVLRVAESIDPAVLRRLARALEEGSRC